MCGPREFFRFLLRSVVPPHLAHMGRIGIERKIPRFGVGRRYRRQISANVPVERKIFKYSIIPYLYPRFTITGRT